MSGGSYNYLTYAINDMATDSRMTGGTPLRRAFAKHLELVSKAAHDIEWVDSGDCSPGDEDEAIRACLGEHAELEELVRSAHEARGLLTAALNRAYKG